MKQIVFFFMVSIAVCSCKEKQTELFDSNDNNKYSLRLELLGGSHDRTTIYLNTPKVKDTLIVYKCYNDYTDSCDISRVGISKIDQDSLYSYFKKAFSKFNINGEGKDMETVELLKLSIFSKSNSMSISCPRANTTNPDVTQIANFLNRRIDKEFQFN